MWKTFIGSHRDVLAAIDFTIVEVRAKGGLITFYLLFLIDLKTRRVHFAGCTVNPNEVRMQQIGRNLIDDEDGFLLGKEYLLIERDTKFCESFRRRLQQSDIEPVILPPRSPNLNSYQERFMLSIKSECLNCMIFFGENSLRTAVQEYLIHYHTERNHQGLDNKIIAPDDVGQTDGEIERRQRLGGLLNYYHRQAA